MHDSAVRNTMLKEYSFSHEAKIYLQWSHQKSPRNGRLYAACQSQHACGKKDVAENRSRVWSTFNQSLTAYTASPCVKTGLR